MEFVVTTKIPEKKKNTCIVFGIFESRKFFNTAKRFYKISNGYIDKLLDLEKIEGTLEQTLLLYHVPNISYDRIFLIGCGKEEQFDEYKYKKIFKKTINILKKNNILEIICCLTELNVENYSTYWKIRKAIEIVEENFYNFNQLKTKEKKTSPSLEKVIFKVLDYKDLSESKLAIHHGLVISKGIKITKNLSNMPPNICNSVYISSKVHELLNSSEKKNVTTYVINEQKMKQLNMNAYLSVGNGSKNESLMSIIEYKGSLNQDKSPIVLIGKGLTFDSGGISIKPSEGMNEMKYDMCGAAAVYGIMKIVIELKLPLNVIGVLACCENMLSGNSYRPGDILTTMSGKTVEVLNTDAEGRLVLCDVLTYVERFNPDVVIDIATLTGACIIALGHHFTGLISNSNLLAKEIISASEQSGDRVWQLPLDEEFQKYLKSNFADMVNVGGRAGGVITSGCFLSRFANKYNWAHLDIAGTSWNLKLSKSGATGRPVSMISQFLINRANHSTKK